MTTEVFRSIDGTLPEVAKGTSSAATISPENFLGGETDITDGVAVTTAVTVTSHQPATENSFVGHMEPAAATAKKLIDVYGDALRRLADS